MSASPPQYYRYRVTDVWGSMSGRFRDNEIIIDTDHGDEHEYMVWNGNTGKIDGGWHVERIGAVTDDETVRTIENLRGVDAS